MWVLSSFDGWVPCHLRPTQQSEQTSFLGRQKKKKKSWLMYLQQYFKLHFPKIFRQFLEFCTGSGFRFYLFWISCFVFVFVPHNPRQPPPQPVLTLKFYFRINGQIPFCICRILSMCRIWDVTATSDFSFPKSGGFFFLKKTKKN